MLLGHNNTQLREVLKGHKREQDATLCGKANINPILYTCVYDVNLTDGNEKECSANVIYKNRWEQADSEGNEYIY